MKKTAKHKIKQALVFLLQTDSFETITITDLVNTANINRSTYYYHYYRIEEVLKEIKMECIHDLVESIKSPYKNKIIFEINQDVLPSSINLFNHVYQKRKFYKALLNSDLAYSFQNDFIDVIVELFQYDFRPVESNEGIFNKFYSNFNAYGIFSMIVEWVENDFSQSPYSMAKQLTNILYHKPKVIRANFHDVKN
ncbi:TetR-like C-terminal domain-containing protein [Oceanobacillus sp. CAU 1775]